MKISASFLGVENIPACLEALNQTDVDFIHVDVMDGKYVKQKTLPFQEMRHISNYTQKRLDVHLMVEKPSEYIDQYATLNTEYITIHQDIKEDVLSCLMQIKNYAIKTGLALNLNDTIQEMIPYLPYLDLILVMGVVPGKSGQEFLEETKEKLKEVQQLKKEYPKLNFLISIDGGINDKNVHQIKDFVDIIVSGSYITKSKNYQEAVNCLKEERKEV